MKRIILCADDYGQNSAVSQAIVELIAKKRLTATSCLSTSPEWSLHSKALLPFKEQVDLGLHFNLTEGIPLSQPFIQQYGGRFPALSRLIIQAFTKKLDKKAIYAEFEAQLEQFECHLGQMPSFIDGHQHIHQLPIIREVIISIWKSRPALQGTYIRCTDNRSVYFDWKKSAFLKSVIIQLCGARALKNELVHYHIPHNNSFGGIYQFSEAAHYPKIFPQFLQKLGDGGLIMCHPGMDSEDVTDTIASSRFNEYQYLKSAQFSLDCQSFGVDITRFFNRV